ncbi:ligase-associated DNA damage response DEXH box helicase [Methyloligella sp. 2.7D]|uniref:ligase-associated DNA damage response DEXH box helicase n=1 Tax=unclassified Methyloligella TaxID=2625955 RepID=UPI00157DB07A|nr:ligase-associated DNA damage response DEXH box helicase [Methyloligella sp. GL2]QKP78484.1 ligase-associated DNA damage response DEXH box helicase [Methyloligella sp. GL2]
MQRSLKQGNETGGAALPAPFAGWFAARGWSPHPHQLALLRAAEAGKDTLLIAPTGGGKTLAGFLPSLVDLGEKSGAKRGRGIHTLYVSPLKALAVDIARNLAAPVEEMGLDIALETRTGDTPASRRQRQRLIPPDILLTTPEQIALMLSHKDAPALFADLRMVIFDELHAFASTKRGDLLALDLARLRRFSPDLVTIGLSATVARPTELAAFLMPHRETGASKLAEILTAGGGVKADISILEAEQELPWAGHSARYALPEIYEAIKAHKMSLMFVNTRSQAEMLFHALWAINDDTLPIALHHGSLDVAQRRKVEAAMVAGKLRAVVCTSTLDLGIDWGDVDLVINVGAPKGASRLAQRIGRANHRMDEPSKAYLVPANRFEVVECRAAQEAAAEGAQDTPPFRPGALDVLSQHVLCVACSAPFDADDLFQEVRSAAPYQDLTREDFDKIVRFVATGGYALSHYERYAKLKATPEGLWRIAHPKVAQQYRLNAGTIVEAPMLRVRLARGKGGALKPKSVLAAGRVLGEVEEWFVEQLLPGDTFLFAGEVLRFEGLRENDVIVTRSHKDEPKVPSYDGGKFPLSTYLAERVRRLFAEQSGWARFPAPVSDWLRLQRDVSSVPAIDEIMVESFPRAQKFYLVCYPFEGRLAHQSLGMLLTRRLERLGARPLGFVANEYALAIWGLNDMGSMIATGRLDLDALFDEDMLGDDLDAWLAESNLMKRSFRACATIAGLIERRHPGQEKSGRQMTVSSDLIYDVLREHEPDHILLQAAWADAASGLIDVGRLNGLLKRVKGRIRHIRLDRVSPLAVPVMLEIGRESVPGEAKESLLREAVDELIAEAMGQDREGGDFGPEGMGSHASEL